MMENTIKMDDLGGPPFMEPSYGGLPSYKFVTNPMNTIVILYLSFAILGAPSCMVGKTIINHPFGNGLCHL